MPKVKGKSITRNHFEKIDNDQAKCKLCHKIVKVGGGTSNMLAHLKRNHPEASRQIDHEEQGSTSSCDHQSTSSLSEPSKKLVQSRLKLTPGSNKTQIDKYLTLMIASDFQPFSVVEDRGFKKFVEVLNPNYTLPSREKIRYDLLPEIYLKVKVQLSNLLEASEHVALTTDIWSNQNMDSFITVTVHFFVESELKNYVLTTSEIHTSHTSENLAVIMTSIIAEWRLTSKIVAIVTDNAPNMLRMCELLGIRHMPCFAHTLNLTVTESLNIPQINNLLKKCRDIVRFFKKSSTGSRALKQEQIERNPNDCPLKLIQDISTRWNSTFFMLSRILIMSDVLALVCRKVDQAPDFLTPCDENIVKDIVKVLEIFEDATKLVSADQYPTSSLVIPVICGLYQNLNTIESNLNTDIGKLFCTTIKHSMNKRLLAYEKRSVNQISTYLHPMLRHGFRQSENMLAAKELVKLELANLIRESNTDSVSATTEESTEIKKPSILDFITQRRKENPNATASVLNILRMYVETDPGTSEKRTEVISTFWKVNAHLVPLDKIARKYMLVPATSVPSERMFSTSGYILSSRRSRLKSTAVDQLCFVNQNYDLIN